MKILVSDIDCSLNRFELMNLSDTINRFVRKGNIFILVTDKAINYIADTLALTDIDIEYYLCNDGAVIFDRYFNVLYRKDLKENIVRPIVNMLEDDENILETFIDTSHGFVKEYNRSANGIVSRPFDKLNAEITLNNICMKYPDVKGYINDNWLNIYDSEVDKYNSLKYIIDNYRLDSTNIYSLCHAASDINLIKNTKGYTLVNCFEDLKQYSKGEFNNLKQFVEYLINEDLKEDDYII